MTASPLAPPQSVELPPVVQEQWDAPAPERRGWLPTIAPAYLGVFVWFPFLDPLGVVKPGSTGLAARILSAALAVICCHVLLYYGPAMLGFRSGRRLSIVAAVPFGAQGAEWITGVLYGLFAGVLCAVSIYYSVNLTLLGLFSWGLLDPRLVHPGSLGGLRLESPLVLTALAFWLFIIAAANGLRLMNVIAALMRVYAPVALALLWVTAAWALWSPPSEVSLSPGLTPLIPPDDSLFDARVFQLVFGYFAFAGLMGVEWGSVVKSRKDVKLGGWVGILVSGTLAITAGLIAATIDPGPRSLSSGMDQDFSTGSLRGAFFRGINASLGGWAAGALLLLFGLAALAPACYASKIFADRCRGHWPMLRGRLGGPLGYGLIFALMAFSLAPRLEAIFTIGGALFASTAGVLMVEAIWNRGPERAIRGGWRWPGIAAWLVGALVGLAPLVGASIQPAALLAFAASALVYGAVVLATSRRSSTATAPLVAPEES